MSDPRKPYRPPSNTVYVIDGASYGLDDDLAGAIRASIRGRIESGKLDVPRLPQAASRILQLSQNPNSTLDEIVRAITTDPLLATRILSAANSAALGRGERISGLRPALMRLGSKVLMDMVFAESISLLIFSAKSYRSMLEESLKLSLGTAIACNAMSKITGLEPEGAFLLGLLHDTGKPVLAGAVAEYERQNNGRPLGEDVVEILMSQLHEEIGAYVLENWGMPASIITAAGAHHRYQGAAHATPAHQLVFAGNLMCQHLGIGDIQRDVDFTIERVFTDLGLADLERVAPILDAVSQSVEGMMAGLRAA